MTEQNDAILLTQVERLEIQNSFLKREIANRNIADINAQHDALINNILKARDLPNTNDGNFKFDIRADGKGVLTKC